MFFCCCFFLFVFALKTHEFLSKKGFTLYFEMFKTSLNIQNGDAVDSSFDS